MGQEETRKRPSLNRPPLRNRPLGSPPLTPPPAPDPAELPEDPTPREGTDLSSSVEKDIPTGTLNTSDVQESSSKAFPRSLGAAPRPRVLRTPPVPVKKGGGGVKIVAEILIVLLLGSAAATIFVKKDGVPLYKHLLGKGGAVAPATPEAAGNDPQYKEAVDTCTRAWHYVKFDAANAEAEAEQKQKDVVAELEKRSGEVAKAAQYFKSVPARKTDLEYQEKVSKEIAAALEKWKGPVPFKTKEPPKKEEPFVLKPAPPTEAPKEMPKETPPPPAPEPPKPEEPKKEEPVVQKPVEEPKKEEPAVEPSKPKEKTTEDFLAEADKDVVSGTTLFREIAETMNRLPDDQDKLKALLQKSEAALSLMTRGRDTYGSVRDRAPASVKVEEKISKIEKIVSLLKNYEDRIRSKVK